MTYWPNERGIVSNVPSGRSIGSPTPSRNRQTRQPNSPDAVLSMRLPQVSQTVGLVISPVIDRLRLIYALGLVIMVFVFRQAWAMTRQRYRSSSSTSAG